MWRPPVPWVAVPESFPIDLHYAQLHSQPPERPLSVVCATAIFWRYCVVLAGRWYYPIRAGACGSSRLLRRQWLPNSGG